MPNRAAFRRLLLGLLASLALAAAGLTAPVIPAATPAVAQISAEFQEALEPYGHWERHPRWGEVWVPDDIPPDWRPYEYGHWVYTDEWGWYWISDPEEEDWGWVAYHYGRWAHDRRLGWFWIPGDEWAPAWVDWRYGDDYVGWAPLPPEELIYEYDEEPGFWIFVPPRFMTARHFRPYMLRPSRRAYVFHRSHVINRTLRYGRHRAAVNPGISPAFVARHTRRPLPTYRVSPHVLAGTQGVAGAVRVSPQQLRAPGPRGRRPSTTHFRAVTVQRTTTTIKPTTTATAPQPLGKNERGRLGTHPPRAAQGAPAVQPLQQPPPQRQLQQQQQRQMQPPPGGNHREERRNGRPPARNGGVRTPPPAAAKPPPPPAVTKPAQPRVMHPPPAVTTKPLTPPKPPQVRRAAPPQAPAVRHAPPPQQPRVRRAPPQHAPQARRPAPHPAQVRRAPPPKGQPAGKRAPAKPQAKRKPGEQPR